MTSVVRMYVCVMDVFWPFFLQYPKFQVGEDETHITNREGADQLLVRIHSNPCDPPPLPRSPSLRCGFVCTVCPLSTASVNGPPTSSPGPREPSAGKRSAPDLSRYAHGSAVPSQPSSTDCPQVRPFRIAFSFLLFRWWSQRGGSSPPSRLRAAFRRSRKRKIPRGPPMTDFWKGTRR